MNTNKIKNVLLLSIDALSYRLLESAVKKSDSFRAFTKIHNGSLRCVNAFSNGLPTQMAFPSIFSSTLPLDAGGYNYGIKNRSKSFVELLQGNGFATAGFSTVNFLGKYYSYDRGFDFFYEIYNIKRFWNSLNKNCLSYYFSLLNDGKIFEKEYCAIVRPIIRDAFKYLLDFSIDKKSESDLNFFGNEEIVYGYDFNEICNYFTSEYQHFQKDPDHYVLSVQKLIGKFNNAFLQAKYAPGFWGSLKKTADVNTEQLMLSLMGKLGISYPYILKRYDHFVSASYLVTAVTKWIEAHKSTPFFLWTHFLDLHEGNYTSGRFQMPMMHDIEFIKKRLKGKEDARRYHNNEVSLKALKYLDTQINRLLSYLETENLLKDTLVILTADHGMEAYELPRNGHKAVQFYDEYVKVPLMFLHPSIKAEPVSELTSHLDIAPTLLKLLGIENESTFSGFPIKGERWSKRECVIAENAGRGPCDINRKSINIMIRTKTMKYIWTERNHRNQNELYDLIKDQKESRNLVMNPDYEAIYKKMNSLAEQRCESLKLQ